MKTKEDFMISFCNMTKSIAVGIAVLFVSSASASEQKSATKTEAAGNKSQAKKESKKDKSTAKEVKKMNPNAVMVTMVTNKGTIKIELDKEKAPGSVENFVGYVKSGHYDKTIFHRVINQFMIQGGGFDEKMTQKATKAPIKTEASNGLKNVRGTIAMARTNDVNSATSQFFINLVDNPYLDFPNNGGYTVFGKVTEGMNVVDDIATTKTSTFGMHSDVPVKPVVIESVKVD
jgi:cyclophilin family peptidyl-prolyl cis-trans isomerase